MPNLDCETQYINSGKIVAGIDEAGRGPWAGPVVAAAVILNIHDIPTGINDSKKLTARKREIIYEEIIKKSNWSCAAASVEEIDNLNILAATKLAMKRAVNGLIKKPDIALVDGNSPPELDCQTITIIKGDSKSLSIAAASIIAKVTRDRIMRSLDLEFPGYYWKINSGYGTKAHQEALEKFGITPFHRQSFAPIKKLVNQTANQKFLENVD